jgi:hypothetical protein
MEKERARQNRKPLPLSTNLKRSMDLQANKAADDKSNVKVSKLL